MQEKGKKIKIFILSIIFLIVILFLGVISINKNIQKNKIYQLQNKTDYEVTLKPNNFFLNDKLKANNYYIADSIKDIDIYFAYYLKNKEKENINYSYDITAIIKSYADNGTKLIWTKDFNLKNTNNRKEKEIKINENYQINYPYYVNYIKSFEKYYNIKTESYLYVKLNVKTNDKDNSYILLTIPLSENIIEITLKEENTFLKNNKQNIDLKIFLIILVTATALYLLIKILFNKNNEKTILKSYQDIIITIQNKPNINIGNSIYLTNLKDLMNIAINNNSNIFNYQNNYYTIIDNIYYIYNFEK